MLKKMPPPEKIYEAWTAVAAGRVTIEPGSSPAAGSAEVSSSNGEKTYYLAWRGNDFSSTDSASFWQGYPGYPVIAVLMSLGRLPCNPEDARLFAHIDWNAANKAAKRDYAKALANVVASLNLSPQRIAELEISAQNTWLALKELDLTLKRPKKSGGKGA